MSRVVRRKVPSPRKLGVAIETLRLFSRWLAQVREATFVPQTVLTAQ
jgi:hypothetical protein